MFFPFCLWLRVRKLVEDKLALSLASQVLVPKPKTNLGFRV